MNDFLAKHKFGFLFIIPGVIIGFLYWKYVGCVSGTCPLRSHWHTMVVFGAAMGYFIGDNVDDYIKKRKNNREKEESQSDEI
jgi:UDP-N-acetylmuramyl pentapeptide phosphotransferase/UDP-N-acetylglucosamine-1-phosphate transferase